MIFVTVFPKFLYGHIRNT
jgi:hypothetical protein